jgi:hypothetical protein
LEGDPRGLEGDPRGLEGDLTCALTGNSPTD